MSPAFLSPPSLASPAARLHKPECLRRKTVKDVGCHDIHVVTPRPCAECDCPCVTVCSVHGAVASPARRRRPVPAMGVVVQARAWAWARPA